MTYNVFDGMLNLAQSINQSIADLWAHVAWERTPTFVHQVTLFAHNGTDV